MFGIGSTELLLILVVALVVLGPKSLAGFARTMGKFMGEFRRVSTEFQRTLNVESAREEAREQARQQAAKNRNASSPAPEQAEDIQGFPPDSPVAREIARAREQARQAEEPATGERQDVNKVAENNIGK